ncbi:MAG: MEDS domain-containing protein [Myxococcota bacterium]
MARAQPSDVIPTLRPGDHVCLFYESQEEQRAWLVPFFREGLRRGEACVYIMDQHHRHDVAAALHAGGVDVRAEVRRGALSLLTQDDTYLRGGRFDPGAMITLLQGATRDALRRGFTALRVTGEMTWSLGGEPGCERLVEYESLLNDIFPRSKTLAICQYHRPRFPAELLLGALRTHPTAILGEDLCANPYCEPAGLLGDGARVEWMFAQLPRWCSADAPHPASVPSELSVPEVQRRALAAREQHVERMLRARDNILRVVAHDLRDPLNVVLMAAHKLQRLLVQPVPRQSVDTIVRAVNQARRLIHDLRDVALIEAGRLGVHPTPQEVTLLVEDARSSLLAHAEERGLDVEVRVSPELPPVLADRERVHQVFSNLIGNAAKFTPAGGRISLGASRLRHAVCFSVVDNGRGIPHGNLERVFEPFWQQVAGEGRGSGLGLAISKGIVEAHGGRIWAEAEEGWGSAFHFTLPVAAPRGGIAVCSPRP